MEIDIPPIESQPHESARFIGRLRSCIEQTTFVKLILAKYCGTDEPDLRNVTVRAVTIKGAACLSFVYRHHTRDITQNVPVADGLNIIRERLGTDFKTAHLFALTENVQVSFSKKGACTLSVSKATCPTLPPREHNREKSRIIDPRSPFLTALGITNEQHQVLPSMSRKWKQINVFLEIFQSALTAAQIPPSTGLRVVDFGSGKGYLTFALHEFLNRTPGIEARVTGVEVRDELVRLCNEVASNLNLTRLDFRTGDVQSYTPEPIQVMIALHACDTATDLAIHLGIRAGAAIILCAPCCHKELRPQMRNPTVLQPVLQFGVHLGQEAEMVTDSLRALLLEASGYETQVFEFISLEHTSKNKMILAVKRKQARQDDANIQAKIRALKDFYGIQTQCLDSLLKADGADA